MAEQEANQVNENPQTSEQAGKATVNGDGAGGQVFSQDEVNRMIKARAERELKAVLADVGLSDLGELKTLVQQKRAAEDANKSELAKAQERAAELEKQLADAVEKQKTLSTLSDITAKAAKLGIVDPDAAYKLLNRSELEYGDDGAPTNTETLLVALLKDIAPAASMGLRNPAAAAGIRMTL